jgi:2-amino-4-hydroxy-6-hydroxymethyldihydropteridine diphosphokinase
MDSAALLNQAIDALSEAGAVVKRSSLYRTEPVGMTEQPVFLNAVVELETEMTPAKLLRFLLAVEQRFGRERIAEMKNGPRTMDLDLLLYGGLVTDTEELVLPHPRLAERRFVLTPLAEIAAEVMHPVFGKTMLKLLEELPRDGQNGVLAVRVVGGGADDWRTDSDETGS